MKKSFQKTLIAASVGVVLAAGSTASFAAAIGQTNLLFPYVSTGANAYTFVTVLTPSTIASAPNNKVHFAYSMKSVTAPNFSTVGGSSSCDHSDGTGTYTTNDVMQFEIRNRINLPAAFSDTTSVPYYYNGGTDKQGFLIVNSNAGATGNTGAAAILYGEAIVIDTASGMRLAYSSNNLNTTDAANPDFTIDNTGVAGGVEVQALQAVGTATNSNSVHMVSWMQSSAVTTGWFVAPLGLRSEMTPSAGGGLTAAYNMYQSDYSQTGAYNNNEAFQSGAAPTRVQCLGVIQRSDILLAAGVVNTQNGGWSNLVTFNGDDENVPPTGFSGTTGTQRNKSLVYKLQSSNALGGNVSTISREANR